MTGEFKRTEASGSLIEGTTVCEELCCSRFDDILANKIKVSEEEQTEVDVEKVQSCMKIKYDNQVEFHQ